jgi:hypothetical protein
MGLNPGGSGVGEWRSLVAHLLWEQRVAGSNPVSPTIFQIGSDWSGRSLESRLSEKMEL